MLFEELIIKYDLNNFSIESTDVDLFEATETPTNYRKGNEFHLFFKLNGEYRFFDKMKNTDADELTSIIWGGI